MVITILETSTSLILKTGRLMNHSHWLESLKPVSNVKLSGFTNFKINTKKIPILKIK